MRTLKIEKNIPFPDRVYIADRHNKNTTAITKALLDMRIGDSFVIGESFRMTVYNRASCYSVGVSIRKWGHGTVRVWRVI